MGNLVVLDGAGGRRREQLPEEVAAYLRELILTGAVRSGEFLRMEPIAEALGVSNTPVREGLLTLRNEGFVRLVPRRGFVVVPFSRRDVQDLYWAQAQLAGELAARAAGSIQPVQLERAQVAIDLVDAAVAADDLEAIAWHGRDFHRQVNLAAGSYRLALLLNSMSSHLPNRVYAQMEAQVAGARQEHRQVLDALRRRDANSARRLMQDHVLAGSDRLIGALEERGIWADEG